MAELDASGLRPLDATGLQPVTRDTDAPPLSAEGLKPLDASGLKPAGGDETRLSDYPIEFGKSFVEGAKNLPASSLKGLGAAEGGFYRKQLDIMDRVDRGEEVPPLDDATGYQDMPPELRTRARAEMAQYAEKPTTQRPLYRAGQAIEDFGKETLGPRKGFEGETWTRDIGSGFGSVAGGIAMALVNPEAAMLAWVSSGSGEAADRAIKAGATEEQITRAAQFGSIAGATDAVDGMLPMLGTPGKVMGFIKRVGTHAIKGAFAEGGQEGVQQLIQNAIAQGIYNPDQDLWEGVPRNALIGAIVGGTTGGITSAAEGRGHRAPATAEAPGEAIPAGALLPEELPQPVPRETLLAQPAVGSPVAGSPAAPTATPLVEPPAPLYSEGLAGPPATGTFTPTPPVELPPVSEGMAGPQDYPPITQRVNPGPPPPEPAGRFTLQKLLADPRTAEEMKADMAAQAAIDPQAVMALPDGVVTPRVIKAFEAQFDDGKRVPGLAVSLPRSVTDALDAAGLTDAQTNLVTYAGLQALKAEQERRAAIPPTPGSRDAPVELQSPGDVHVGAEQTAAPTPAQAEAGNYQKRHVTWNGLDITVETEAGQQRSGIGQDGTPWSVTLPSPYGYIKRTKGADGDHLDVYLGPEPASPHVFVIDQIDADHAGFDEHKAMLGFPDLTSALATYDGAFSDGRSRARIGAVRPMSVHEFKTWVASGDTRKALAYVEPVHAGLSKPQFSELHKLVRDRSHSLDPAALAEALGAPPASVRQVLGRMVTTGFSGLRQTAAGIQRAPKRGPLDLFQFLASIGGIRDHGGELRARDLHQTFIPGYGKLVRAGGVPLDVAREAAVEAGYLHDAGFRGEGQATSTINDLLEAIDWQSRGNKLYSLHDLAEMRERQATEHAAEGDRRLKDADDQVRAAAKSIGITNLTDAEAHAAAIAVANGEDPEEALTEVVTKSYRDALDDAVVSESEEPSRGEAAENDTARADQGRAGPPPPREQPARPQAEAAPEPPPRGEQPGGAQPARPESVAAPVVDLKVNMADLRTYANAVIGDDVRSVFVIGSVARNGAGNDIDLLYYLGERTLSNDPTKAADEVEQIIEGVPNLDLDKYDSFFKVGDRYFHVSEGAGRAVVENTDYARLQKSKPSKLLARAGEEAPAASERQRAFPSYTTQQLRDTLADSTRVRNMRPEVVEKMRAEVAAREAGTSTERVTPQIGGAGAWKPIGKNESGQTLYEDQRGVRSYIENGVRSTEPVAIRPTRAGVEASPKEHKGEWALASEAAPAASRPAENAEQPQSQENGSERTPSVPAGDYALDDTNASANPTIELAKRLLSRLKSGRVLTAKEIQELATEVYGGKLAEGKFDRKDTGDALELAINMLVKDDAGLRVDGPNGKEAIARLRGLVDRMPTQRVRTEEMVRFQQFSTPPDYAAAVVYAANLQEGDVVLEPSAGTGSIVAAASQPGVTIIANELSPRRADMLRALMGEGAQITHEDAEQLDNILPADVKPTVVVMNPPFSQTAGRMGDQKDVMVGARHIEQALSRLEDGGRLVAIVGSNMAPGQPKFRPWFSKIGREYAIRANILVDGKVYAKYGTTFDNRVYVIDKVAPDDKPTVTGEAKSTTALAELLESVRNGRNVLGTRPAQSNAAEPRGAAVAGADESADRGDVPASPEPGSVGSGERGGRRVAEPGETGAARPGEPAVQLGPEERAGVAVQQPERPGEGRAGEQSAAQPATGERSEPSGSVRAERDLEPASGGQPGPAASSERVELENAAPGKQATAEISESLYESYEPQRVRVKGAKPHPGPLVESAAMASVEPPTVHYQPKLPRKVIDAGQLSLAQLEAVVYAGQAHEQMLEAAEGQVARRKGYFIGDGTGVGKGREISGIILDNFQHGRTRALWVSENKKLIKAARRDWSGLGQDAGQLFEIGKIKNGEPIKASKGIGFITYDTMKGGMSDQAALTRGQFIRNQQVSVNGQAGAVQRFTPGRGGKQADVTVKLDNGTTVTVPMQQVTAVGTASVKSRVDQIVEWVGADFDGVIAFDEAHNMANAAPSAGERGVKDAAQKALAGIDLQKRLPNARVVYVSATGATEVSNLVYADRLGLWGRGTAFASADKFVSEVEKGGVAAMELIARDMKQLGMYTARNLSYDGVEYERLEHKLDGNQREIYDTLADAWQNVLRNITAALELTNGNTNGRAKSAAASAFWGGHQRFFNQIVTSLQMPSVIKAVEKDIAEGRQAVLQLTNTNEASQERAAAKATTAEEIEDLDITPRDQVIQLVEKSFPTQQYETYVDENGKERSRPVVGADGQPVQNKKAVAMKEALIDKLSSIRVPQGPLDMILDHFGVDVAAEVTGRGRRFVIKEDDKGVRRRMEESRPGSSNLAEIEAFQSGKKKVLVFSQAGGTGESYHADNTAASKGARRVHYLVQGGWRADKAVQGFGRTHRTNQASAPIFKLVTTDLQGQKRFISSIARRLAQLGALTKGQRQAGDQGIFTARDNLESREAHIAVQQFFNDLVNDRVPDITVGQFEEETGLKLRNLDEEGGNLGSKTEYPPITQFLNRLLSLKIDTQNAVFDAFSQRLDNVIESREQAGLLDVGVETIKADKITKDTERVVHTTKNNLLDSGAETKHVKLTLANKFVPLPFDTIANNKNRTILFFAKSPNDKVYAVAAGPSITDEGGKIIDNYRVISPVSESRVTKQVNIDAGNSKWSKIDKAAAEKAWAAEIAAAPEFVTRDMHLITGAVLPIWDRLKGNPRVVRLQTDSGERLIGRVVPNSAIATTLKALGAEGSEQKVAPGELITKLLAGARATLANGWTLSRRLVAGEHRIELKGPSSFSEANEVKADGVFSERIEYTNRYFVPTDAVQGAKVLEAITKHRPVTDVSDVNETRQQTAAGDEDALFALGHPSPKGWARAEPNFDAPVKMPKNARLRIFTGKYDAQARELYPTLRSELDRIGLKDVGLRLVDRMEMWSSMRIGTADGMYFQSLITLAIEAEERDGYLATMHHEAMHALRRLGMFTDGENAILERASNTQWRRDFKIDDRYSKWPEETKTEEGIAFAYQAWIGGKLKPEGRIVRLFKRIRDFLDAVGNAFRGHGFKSAEDIFRDVLTGKVGNRQPRDLVNGQFSRDGQVAYAVRSGDGDLFKSEIVQTPDGPREQAVIPGAEKISDKNLAERRGAAPKRSDKAQKGTDGLPLFGDEKDQGQLFSLTRDPETAVERTRVMQGFLARGQALDRAIRMPFDWFGGTTYDGQWKPGLALYEKAANVITSAKFSPDGRFSFLNPIMETARAGLVDRYGLEEAYVTRERERALDERAVMLQGAEVLKSLKAHSVGKEEARVLQAILTGEDVSDADMGKLAEPIRAAIDQLGQEAVDLGLVSPESFERNRGTYLHRVYQKYEADQNGLTRMVNNIMGSRRKKIIGDQFRGRGMFQEVDVGRLMRDVPGWIEAERGRPVKGERFVVLDDMANQQELAPLDGKAAPEKTLRRVYWPADRAIPDRYAGFTDQGTWEVRGEKNRKIVIWRDFTKDERVKMGEIVDARYTIGKTFMLMAHDLSVGKFYKDIAENEDWARSAPPAGKWVDAEEWRSGGQRLVKRGAIEWVRVPDTEIPSSGGKKRWGGLAGKFVREEIWRDLNEIAIMSRPGVWRALLTQWKLNKTARSPVVHMNNVMSNFVLMDMLDVRFQDLAAGIRSYIAKDAEFQEAMLHGAFGADMMSQEVRDQVLKPVLEELMRANTFQQGAPLGALGQVTKFTELLWSKLKLLDQKMIDLYRVEDEIFRMGTYIRRRQLGDDAKTAADHAREQFIDYDIRAPWVNMARNSVLPFISYTYRAAPMVAKAVATRPWKLAKYFMLAYGVNALAYALMGGDEDKERRSLREAEQGHTWIGANRMMRMPFNDRHVNPVFLDIRRWVPAGDVFDLSNGDMPAWLNFGGPLMIGAELMLNRAAFTGQDIVNTKIDDIWDRTGKRLDHLYKSWAPSAAWVPESWYWEKIANAAHGATDRQGRPYSIGLAAASSVGIKLKPQDVQDGLAAKGQEFGRIERELEAEAGRMARQHQRGLISDSAFEKAMQSIVNKKERLGEKARDTLK